MGSFALGPQSGVLNVAVSNFAKTYSNPKGGLIGDQLAPRVSMMKQVSQFVIHGRDGMRLDGDDLRAPGAAPRAIRSSFSTAFYNCKSHARMAEVPLESEQWALGFGFSQQAKASQQVLDLLLLSREVYLANLAAGAGTTVALSGTSMWDNASSTPIHDVTYAKSIARQSGVAANLLVLGDPVADALLVNPQIVARFVNTEPGVPIDMDGLSRVLSIKCVRASAIQVDKNDAVSFVWGQTATLAYVQEASDQNDLSSFKTFVWDGAPDTVSGYSVMVEPKYPLSSRASIISADWYWDIQNTAPETTYTFTNCCATPTYETLAPFPAAE